MLLHDGMIIVTPVDKYQHMLSEPASFLLAGIVKV